MNIRQTCTLLGLLSIGAAHAQATFIFEAGTSYLSTANIPAGFYLGGAPTFLDNLEDDALNGNLTASVGSVIGVEDFGSLVDSVQADSVGVGRSFFSLDGATGITFTFNGATLPTAFALVVTDVSGAVTFSAFGAGGTPLGSIVRTGFQDGLSNGGTAEDRFFGAIFAGGIRSLSVSAPGGGIEVDHIQYGVAGPIPEPSAALLLLGGLGAVGAAARRARRR